jgi:hypothetical protein
MVRSVLQLHKDEMHARSERSTAPHFVRGDKVTIVAKNIFLRGQPNKKVRDRQLGPSTVEQIEKHSYILKLPATIRLHPVLLFYVNTLGPCLAASLRLAASMNVPKGDDKEFDVSHISAVCIKSLPERRGKYSLFITH